MAGNSPPAYGVEGGPAMRASHKSRLDSEIGPAVMPSGGEEVRFLYSWNNRLEAIEEAIFGGGGTEWGVEVAGEKTQTRLKRMRVEIGEVREME